MLSRMHQKLGTAGFVVAIVALVVALTGAAFAAGGLTKQQEKQVTKIAKKYAGKPGKPGPAGPQGPAGAPGAKGDTGPKGDRGEKGEKGDRGERGEEGLEGSPWTAGGVLPSGETETGTWSVGIAQAASQSTKPLSFNIPLATAPTAVHFGEEETTECPGNVANPEAAPGNVCVYVEFEENLSLLEIAGFPLKWKSGVVLLFNEGAGAIGAGTWAVTAE